MRWYLNPFRIRDAARDACRIGSGGGPRSVRLSGIGKPEGWLVPSSTVGLQVRARDGTHASFEPELPIPLPLAYGYRLARTLNVPLIGTIEPERIELRLGSDP